MPLPRHVLPVLPYIWIRICYLDHQQNLIICSLAHCQPSLKISCKSIWKFLHEVANRKKDKQTNDNDCISSLAEVVKQLLGEISFMTCRSLLHHLPENYWWFSINRKWKLVLHSTMCCGDILAAFSKLLSTPLMYFSKQLNIISYKKNFDKLL